MKAVVGGGFSVNTVDLRLVYPIHDFHDHYL